MLKRVQHDSESDWPVKNLRRYERYDRYRVTATKAPCFHTRWCWCEPA
jgi:hypothetical protein